MEKKYAHQRRILMIAPTPFFADRGCHVRILGEAQALIALGNEVVLCTYSLGKNIDGVPTERSIVIPWYKKLSPGPSYHKFYIDLLLLWKILTVCYKFRPSVIHAHLHEGIVLGRIASLLFGIPMIADLQGSLTQELLDHNFIPRSEQFLKLMHRIEKVINRMPHFLVASSTHTAQICRSTFGLDSGKIMSIMDGADPSIFSPGRKDLQLRASLGIGDDKKVVIFIGVLTQYQGIDLLLEAIPFVARECPSVKFLIVGYPNEARYQEKARALGVEDHICFTGKVPYEDTPRYLSLADIAISPKISTTEANLKLFTYMAMGLPVVVFDNPVNREILGSLGIYAKMGDPGALADALVTILRDQIWAEQLGNQIREKAVSEYSWLAVGKRLMTIYDAVLNRTDPIVFEQSERQLPIH